MKNGVKGGRSLLQEAGTGNEAVRTQEYQLGWPVVEPFLDVTGVVAEDQDVVVHVLLGPGALGFGQRTDQAGAEGLKLGQ